MLSDYDEEVNLSDEWHAAFDGRYTVADNGCWIWTGGKTTGGYGQAGWGKGSVDARRRSYALAYGGIPGRHGRGGAVIMHTRDNPPCINPRHLKAGSHADNMRDCAIKGVTAGQS
jgi:hypothetical protein